MTVTDISQARPRLEPRRHWADDALCIGEPLEAFFGTEHSPLTYQIPDDVATLCRLCPVRRDCLLDALLHRDRSGIRAGFQGYQRAAALRRHNYSVAAAMDAYDRGEFTSRTDTALEAS